MNLDEARRTATVALMSYKSVLLKEAQRVHELLEAIDYEQRQTNRAREDRSFEEGRG